MIARELAAWAVIAIVGACGFTAAASSTMTAPFAVTDGGNRPIFTVPSYGGPSVDGDRLTVLGSLSCTGQPPVCTISHDVVIAPWSPAGYYARQVPPVPVPSCDPPAKWIEPGGTWRCESGAWIRIGS